MYFQYAVSIYNRFQELSAISHLDSRNIVSIYDDLMKASEEVALPSFLQEPKSRKNQTSSDENLRKISSMYHANLSQTNYNLTAAKDFLNKAYFETDAAFINGKVDNITNLNINKLP